MCVYDHSSTSFPETRSQSDLELAHMVTLAGQLALGRSSSLLPKAEISGGCHAAPAIPVGF